MKTFPHFFRSPEELSSERARRRDVREMSFVTGNIVIGGDVDGVDGVVDILQDAKPKPVAEE